MVGGIRFTSTSGFTSTSVFTTWSGLRDDIVRVIISCLYYNIIISLRYVLLLTRRFRVSNRCICVHCLLQQEHISSFDDLVLIYVNVEQITTSTSLNRIYQRKHRTIIYVLFVPCPDFSCTLQLVKMCSSSLCVLLTMILLTLCVLCH